MSAYAQSTPLLPHVAMLSLFAAGAFVMRGAGCIMNDLWDRDLDRNVSRTASRPLASGVITPFRATAFLGSQLAIGLMILAALPQPCHYLGASSLFLVATYPYFKRITYYPQFVLGATFSWAALLGYPALGGWNLPVMLSLWSSSFCWVVFYDTIYAHQDKKDDILVGIKSTALKWGEESKTMMSWFAVGQVGLLGLAGICNGQGPIFFLVSVLGGAAHLRYITQKVNLDDAANCWMWFKRSVWTGGIIWAGIVGDYIYALV